MCIIQNHMHFHMFVMRSATLQCVGHKNVIMEYICLIPLWLWSLAVKINPDSDNILSWRDNGQYLEISYSVSHRRRPCDDSYRKHKQAALTEDSEDKQSADVLSSETQRVKTSSWATLCVCFSPEAALRFPGNLSPNAPKATTSVGGTSKYHTCERCGTKIV